MNGESSGCYTIDSDYTLLNMNEAARKLYPQLELGRKCYQCLMGLDSPCPPCPVKNGVKGPHTYIDPIRKIAETVDAVELDLEGHGKCHSLIFSTVDKDETLAATLPTDFESLRQLALINALTLDYEVVWIVDIEERMITQARYQGKTITDKQGTVFDIPYDEELLRCNHSFAVAEDRAMLDESCSIENITERLKKEESFSVHHRTIKDSDGEIHYQVRKIVRVGHADDFKTFILAVAGEDEDVKTREMLKVLESDVRRIRYNKMTGLLAREAFFAKGEKLIRKHPDVKYDFTIMRLENIGMINHQFGRPTGDKILALIGRLMGEYENNGNCIGYLGDAAFASFTENTSNEERKKSIDEFRDKIIDNCSIKSLDMKWAIYKDIPTDLSVTDIFEKTRFALATIRASLADYYVEFDNEMITRLEFAKSVEDHFETDLAAGRFIPWFQPKYDAETGRIVGAEALVRYVRDDGTLVFPDRFIPVLENCGKIGLLDREIYEQVCALQKRLEQESGPRIPISVNLSRASMFLEELPVIYSKIADKYGVSAGLIPIEITESAAVRAESIRNFAGRLIEKSFKLHMDDFGAGYSSLASLQIIPFEAIKIDKTLVHFIGVPQGNALLRHTIAYAHETGLTVVAEGVETAEQLEFLRSIDCDVIQGYYFSGPVDLPTFLGMLHARENDDNNND